MSLKVQNEWINDMVVKLEANIKVADDQCLRLAL